MMKCVLKHARAVTAFWEQVLITNMRHFDHCYQGQRSRWIFAYMLPNADKSCASKSCVPNPLQPDTLRLHHTPETTHCWTQDWRAWQGCHFLAMCLPAAEDPFKSSVDKLEATARSEANCLPCCHVKDKEKAETPAARPPAPPDVGCAPAPAPLRPPRPASASGSGAVWLRSGNPNRCACRNAGRCAAYENQVNRRIAVARGAARLCEKDAGEVCSPDATDEPGARA
eukprot:986340-Pelagomonas_calceolata.AAC.3